MKTWSYQEIQPGDLVFNKSENDGTYIYLGMSLFQDHMWWSFKRQEMVSGTPYYKDLIIAKFKDVVG